MHKKLCATLIAAAATSLMSNVYADSPAQWQAISSQAQISLEQAIAHAVKAVPGKVVEIEIDDGDNTGVRYEAQVITAAGESVEVWVNAANGQAQQHAHDGKAKRKDLNRMQEAKVDLSQAIQAATSHTPGKVVKAELDSHWGKTTYKIDVLQPDFTVMELKLDASDGKVISAKHDK